MQHRIRGIAQLVEQRSPKPRAVSSKLTTPAMTHRFFGTCAFCFYALAAGPNHLEWPPHSLWSFSAEILFYVCVLEMTAVISRTLFHEKGQREGNSIFFVEQLQLPEQHFLWKPEINNNRSALDGAVHAEPFQIAVFCNFLKFMLDKQAFFRYNRARSGGNAPRETWAIMAR